MQILRISKRILLAFLGLVFASVFWVTSSGVCQESSGKERSPEPPGKTTMNLLDKTGGLPGHRDAGRQPMSPGPRNAQRFGVGSDTSNRLERHQDGVPPALGPPAVSLQHRNVQGQNALVPQLTPPATRLKTPSALKQLQPAQRPIQPPPIIRSSPAAAEGLRGRIPVTGNVGGPNSNPKSNSTLNGTGMRHKS